MWIALIKWPCKISDQGFRKAGGVEILARVKSQIFARWPDPLLRKD